MLSLSGNKSADSSIAAGACGVCWAFAGVHVIQDRMNIYRTNALGERRLPDPAGPTPDLSIQQAIDCAPAYIYTSVLDEPQRLDSFDSCDGSNPHFALRYALDHAMLSSQAYPYAETYGDCRADRPAFANLPRWSWHADTADVMRPGADSVAGMKVALSSGPVSVSFKVYGDFYQPDDPALGAPGRGSQWVSTIYDPPTAPECVDVSDCDAHYPALAAASIKECDAGRCYYGGHAVELVGWGIMNTGLEYWILKNSWSTAWGDAGFFYVRAGINVADIETRNVLYPRLGYRTDDADDAGVLRHIGGRRDRRTAATDGINNDAAVHWVSELSAPVAAQVEASVTAMLGGTGQVYAGVTTLLSVIGNGQTLQAKVAVRHVVTGATEYMATTITSEVPRGADGLPVPGAVHSVVSTALVPVPPPLATPAPILAPTDNSPSPPPPTADSAAGGNSGVADGADGDDGADIGLAVGMMFLVLIILAAGVLVVVNRRQQAAARDLFGESIPSLRMNSVYETGNSQAAKYDTVDPERASPDTVAPDEGAARSMTYAAAEEIAPSALARQDTLVVSAGTTYAIPVEAIDGYSVPADANEADDAYLDVSSTA